MPILPAEPDVFPDDLLDLPESEMPPALADSQWSGLYTLPRREKKLMRRLRVMEIPFFAPLVPRRTRSPGGRVRTSHVPLFAGYVLLYGTEASRIQALTTNCVSRCLKIADPERLTNDLKQIHRLIASDAALTPESRLESGMRVRVKSGSLAGLEGVVVERRGEERLLVAVEFLQQGVSIQLDDFLVERTDL